MEGAAIGPYESDADLLTTMKSANEFLNTMWFCQGPTTMSIRDSKVFINFEVEGKIVSMEFVPVYPFELTKIFASLYVP